MMGSPAHNAQLAGAREWLLLAVLPLLVFAIYFKPLDGPFILDDINNIALNTNLHISEISWESLHRAAFESRYPNRSVANISLALNFYFHGLDRAGYRIVNICIHILNGILLYFFLRATLNLPLVRKRYGPPGWLPFAATLVWAVNPLHIQSVTYIIQRMNSLSVLFYLAAFLCYIHGRLGAGARRGLLYSCAFLSGLLALGSKEMTVVLPFFIALYELYFFRGNVSFKGIALTVALLTVVLAAGGFLFLGGDPMARMLSGYEDRSFTLAQRLLTEPRVVLFYLGLLFLPLPSRLSIFHDFPVSTSLLIPAMTLPAIVCIGVLVLAAVLYARRSPLLSFCIFWYFGNILVESSFPALEIIFEHRVYLPSMMVVFLAVMACRSLLGSRAVQCGVLALAVALSGYWTYSRNADWSDRILFWQDAVEKFPGSARAYIDLGSALSDAGRFDEAIGYFEKAIELDPDNPLPYHNIGFIHERRWQPHKAIEYYIRALQADPLAETFYRLSIIFAAQGKLQEAYQYGHKALQMQPDNTAVSRHLESIRLRLKTGG